MYKPCHVIWNFILESRGHESSYSFDALPLTCKDVLPIFTYTHSHAQINPHIAERPICDAIKKSIQKGFE